MRRKHWLVISLVVVVLALLIGCAKPAPTVPREEVTLEFYSSVAGTTAYNLHEALCDMLNKKHPWLKASHLETASDVERVVLVDELPTERKKIAIPGYLSIEIVKAGLGMEPYPKKFTDVRMVASYEIVTMYFITYDPDIKTPQDLVGKKIGMFPVGHTMNLVAEPLLKAWGIYDKVKISNHRPTAFKDGLTTGLIDVAWVTGVWWSETNIQNSPYTQEILSARKTYWIPITEADAEAANAMNPWKSKYGIVRKGALGGDNPPTDTGYLAVMPGWCCDVSAEDEVTYELAKFIDENAEGFSEYIPAIKGDELKELMAADPLMAELGHPGALKYYREKGYLK